jgi:hypothetical protein
MSDYRKRDRGKKQKQGAFADVPAMRLVCVHGSG